MVLDVSTKKKLIIDNLAISYTTEGEGKVVVLLHGWGTGMHNLQQMSHYLANQFKVVSLDLPGFGQSTPPKEEWHVHDYALFVQKFLDKLNIKDIHSFVGHSFGGRIIIKGISEGILHSEKAILMGSAGIKPAKSLKSHILQSSVRLGKKVLTIPGIRRYNSTIRRRLQRSLGSEDYINASDDMKKTFINTVNEDLSLSAQNMHIPCLLIWGSDDDQTPVADAHKLNKYIANSKLHVIKGAGHFVHKDAPEIVFQRITNFL